MKIKSTRSSWYDLWHAHPNVEGATRVESLKNLRESFHAILDDLDGWKKPHQCWVLVDPKDPAQDAIYVHTRTHPKPPTRTTTHSNLTVSIGNSECPNGLSMCFRVHCIAPDVASTRVRRLTGSRSDDYQFHSARRDTLKAPSCTSFNSWSAHNLLPPRLRSSVAPVSIVGSTPVDAPTPFDAEERARRNIFDEGWIIESLDNLEPIERDFYAADDDGLVHFDQALVDGETFVFHTWPPGPQVDDSVH